MHTGTLWSSGGQKLATATFTCESTTGWQQVNFSSPVAITAGTTYVASYHTNAGFYSQTTGQFNGQGVDNAPLHAPASASGAGNGVYLYGAGGFPTIELHGQQLLGRRGLLAGRRHDAAERGVQDTRVRRHQRRSSPRRSAPR